MPVFHESHSSHRVLEVLSVAGLELRLTVTTGASANVVALGLTSETVTVLKGSRVVYGKMKCLMTRLTRCAASDSKVSNADSSMD